MEYRRPRKILFSASSHANDLTYLISSWILWCCNRFGNGSFTTWDNMGYRQELAAWIVVGDSCECSTVMHWPSNLSYLAPAEYEGNQNLLPQQALEPYCPEEGRPTVFYLGGILTYLQPMSLLSLYLAVWGGEIEYNAKMQTTTTLEEFKWLSQSMGSNLYLFSFRQVQFSVYWMIGVVQWRDLN